MKLKEAQMLGVLALIAVGIILLCMWGGGSGSSEPKATATDNQTAAATSSPASAPDVAQLTNELLNAPADGSAAAGKDANANMAVGGKTPAQPAGATDAAAVTAMIDRTAPDKIPLTQPKPGAARADAGTTSPAAAVATTTHVVRAGETLSTISQQYYGTKANWKLILDANTSVVKDAKSLKPNMKLVIPAAKGTTAKAVASESADAPSLLSATTFAPDVATAPIAASAPVGAAAATAIAPAATTAPAAASAHATAPAHASAAAPAPAAAIVPAVASEPVAAAVKPAAASVASAAAASSGPRTHTVAKGDTLFRIALKYYGDGNRYKDVLAANRNVISNPSDLKVGMKLVIP